MKYAYIFWYSLKQQLIYRFTMISEIASCLILFLIQINLWNALIEGGYKQGISISDMISFLVLNSAVMTLTQSNIPVTIEEGIRDGSIAMHLLRPVSYKSYLFYTILGKNTYKLFTSVIPILVLGTVFFSFSPPPNALYGILFCISLTIGVLMMLELTYLTGLLAFWMQKTWFLRFYLFGFMTFFGGSVIPLWFYPDFLNRITYLLPFRYIAFEAVNFYLGKTPLTNAPVILGTALLWLLILHLTGNLAWKHAFHKLSVNGG